MTNERVRARGTLVQKNVVILISIDLVSDHVRACAVNGAPDEIVNRNIYEVGQDAREVAEAIGEYLEKGDPRKLEINGKLLFRLFQWSRIR